MKRAVTFSGSLLLIITAVFCTVGALVSAFSLPIDIGQLMLVVIIATITFSIASELFRSKGILTLLALVVIMAYVMSNTIIEGFKQTVFTITTEYNKWLRIPIVFADNDTNVHDLTIFFSAFGAILACLMSYSIILRKSPLLVPLFTAPFVFLTFILTETPPDLRFVLALIAVYLTMAICSFQYPFNYIKRGVVVFPALVLSVIILLTAYLIAPQSKYSRSMIISDLDSYVRNTALRLGMQLNRTGVGWPNVGTLDWRFDTENVTVAGAGMRRISDTSTLMVNSTIPGVFYLRGFSLVYFDGQDWIGNSDTGIAFSDSLSMTMPARILDSYRQYSPSNAPTMARLTITSAGDSTNVIYRPYHSFSSANRIRMDLIESLNSNTEDSNGFMLISDGVPVPQPYGSQYSVMFYYTRTNVIGMYDLLYRNGYRFSGLAGYNELVTAPSVYTQIDESTAKALRQIAVDAGINPQDDRAVIADMVAEYVSSAARYTHNPYVIPEGEDFAVHFLRTSKRGYCIHFATTAALMLRALDIPARFTCGYLLSVSSDDVEKDLYLTDRNAHAWVEVYYDNVGWIPLDATPDSSVFGIPGGVPDRISHAAAAPTPPPDEFETESSTDPYADLPPEYMQNYEQDYYTQTEQDYDDPFNSLGGSRANSPMRTIIIIVSCFLASVIALLIRRVIVRNLREKRFAQLDTNAAVISAWRFFTLVNLRNQDPPEELESIALRARFSLHRISEEERASVVKKTKELSSSLFRDYRLKWRIWLRLIHGL